MSRKKEKNKDRIKVLLNANSIKIDHEYAVKGLIRIALVLLIIGGITYGLSDENVNQNEKFGWYTIGQGVIVLVLYSLVKFRSMYHLLLPVFLFYSSTLLIELIFLGVPNDLLNVYNQHRINTPPNFKIKTNVAVARFIGFIFPFLYLALKLLLSWFVLSAYRKYYKFISLPSEIKDGINTLK